MEVGGTRTAQYPPRDRPGIQNGPNSREARPRLRAHGLNHRSPQIVAHPVCLA